MVSDCRNNLSSTSVLLSWWLYLCTTGSSLRNQKAQSFQHKNQRHFSYFYRLIVSYVSYDLTFWKCDTYQLYHYPELCARGSLSTLAEDVIICDWDTGMWKKKKRKKRSWPHSLMVKTFLWQSRRLSFILDKFYSHWATE